MYDYYFQDRFLSNYPDGNSLADWADLIERFPDCFLRGTDKVGRWGTYAAEVVKYYDLLGRLKPETAEKACRKNVPTLSKQY